MGHGQSGHQRGGCKGLRIGDLGWPRLGGTWQREGEGSSMAQVGAHIPGWAGAEGKRHLNGCACPVGALQTPGEALGAAGRYPPCCEHGPAGPAQRGEARGSRHCFGHSPPAGGQWGLPPQSRQSVPGSVKLPGDPRAPLQRQPSCGATGLWAQQGNRLRPGQTRPEPEPLQRPAGPGAAPAAGRERFLPSHGRRMPVAQPWKEDALGSAMEGGCPWLSHG